MSVLICKCEHCGSRFQTLNLRKSLSCPECGFDKITLIREDNLKKRKRKNEKK